MLWFSQRKPTIKNGLPFKLGQSWGLAPKFIPQDHRMATGALSRCCARLHRGDQLFDGGKGVKELLKRRILHKAEALLGAVTGALTLPASGGYLK
ncbi:hypothetical protein P7K49_012722 [Saguinus oedipus]|uniref:Uncharacterized protein n=1 Tax=Saguinus oedipus TaxID=9490 RepID=A0ABQ9VGU2_SAGOE|nr:hypothetical protein P7K49_012722 [Saguinus oedipus]